MSQVYGIESPREHQPSAHRDAARWLVVIESGGAVVARLFLGNFEQVAEFDAGAEEVAALTSGLIAQAGACGPEWDRALAGHSAAERAAAAVYTLAV